MTLLALALAAAAGALARHGVDGALKRRRPQRPTAAVLTVNVTGSLLLGLLTGLVVAHGAPGSLLTVLGTGFCGSYTTFSTACFETVGLLRRGRTGAAAAHAATTVVATTAAAALGLAVTGALT
ncbi:CrcB family protein [Paenibacillus sp. TRM 82003]|uniref:fluoride efflux transporter FluC n=1 Tax=Kineococcus sp. TRM81007 TaxID=2925831 RepID=UPI001F56B741|nr:CrcB family protein [Kineococcus sp. TRM81007]MCI2240692.1 CrcB family protein [Kineococcus sp. TRM81007]MCI3925386.1 CrcB family protein [Paenibacillus sp. TRM 82003]